MCGSRSTAKLPMELLSKYIASFYRKVHSTLLLCRTSRSVSNNLRYQKNISCYFNSERDKKVNSLANNQVFYRSRGKQASKVEEEEKIGIFKYKEIFEFP